MFCSTVLSRCVYSSYIVSCSLVVTCRWCNSCYVHIYCNSNTYCQVILKNTFKFEHNLAAEDDRDVSQALTFFVQSGGINNGIIKLIMAFFLNAWPTSLYHTFFCFCLPSVSQWFSSRVSFVIELSYFLVKMQFKRNLKTHLIRKAFY